MADTLAANGIDILFVIGGDGSMRGAAGVAQELMSRRLPIGVIGIPKTIENDIPYIGKSFGFHTSFTVAARSIQAARVEAQSAVNGVGLVRVMVRHSGFIACCAALANHDADFVLIPEVPFTLDGDGGLLDNLRRRVAEKGSAVVVVAEGAGQELVTASGQDASGNLTPADIGTFPEERVTADFEVAGKPLTLKYLDPGYAIRSVPAQAADSVYCVRLAQAAVHAAMAGRTPWWWDAGTTGSSTYRSNSPSRHATRWPRTATSGSPSWNPPHNPSRCAELQRLRLVQATAGQPEQQQVDTRQRNGCREQHPAAGVPEPGDDPGGGQARDRSQGDPGPQRALTGAE